MPSRWSGLPFETRNALVAAAGLGTGGLLVWLAMRIAGVSDWGFGLSAVVIAVMMVRKLAQARRAHVRSEERWNTP